MQIYFVSFSFQKFNQLLESLHTLRLNMTQREERWENSNPSLLSVTVRPYAISPCSSRCVMCLTWKCAKTWRPEIFKLLFQSPHWSSSFCLLEQTIQFSDRRAEELQCGYYLHAGDFFLIIRRKNKKFPGSPHEFLFELWN